MHDAVVITGMGLVSCLDGDLPGTWQRLLAGESGIGPITSFDVRDYPVKDAGEAPPLPGGGDPLEAACGEALGQAGIAQIADPARCGLVIGSSLAAAASSERFWEGHLRGESDPALLESYAVEPMLDRLSRRFDLRGESVLVSNACAAGGSSIVAAADLLKLGRLDLVLACGSDPLDLHTFAGFGVIRALAENVMHPFSPRRDGMKLADGHAALVLERESAARRAGRQPLARLLGYGESADAYHRTQPQPQGTGAALAMRRALAMAGLEPDQIDYVNLHATATPANDLAEFRALREVFGERVHEMPLHATKPALGHTLGAAGTVEALVTLMVLIAQQFPPTLGVGELEEEMGRLDLIPQRRDSIVRQGMSNSFGFGGSNTSLIFGVVS